MGAQYPTVEADPVASAALTAKQDASTAATDTELAAEAAARAAADAALVVPEAELAFSRLTVRPANRTATTYADVGLSIPAVTAQDVPCVLRLWTCGPLTTATAALDLQVVTLDDVDQWLYQRFFPGVAFGSAPGTIDKRIPAGVAIPALKVRYKSSVNGQAVNFADPEATKPDNDKTIAWLQIARLR